MQPSNCTSKCLSRRNIKTVTQKPKINIYSSFLRAETWKQPRCPSTVEWLSKLRHIQYHGILLSNRKEWTIDTCNNLDESPENSVQWIEPSAKGYLLYDYIYITYLRGQCARSLWWRKCSASWPHHVDIQVVIRYILQFCKMLPLGETWVKCTASPHNFYN